MATLPRPDLPIVYSRAGQVPDSALRSPWRMLGEGMGEIASFLEPLAIDEARVQGANTVGRDEEGNLTVETRLPLSAVDAAFNHGAQTAALAQLELDGREALGALRTQLEADPGRSPQDFREQSQAYIDATVGRLPDLIRLPAREQLSREASRVLNNYISTSQARQTQEDLGALNARWTAARDDYMALAREFGADDARAMAGLEEWRAIGLNIVADPRFGVSGEEFAIEQRRLESDLVLDAGIDDALTTFQTEGVNAAYARIREIAGDPNILASPSERRQFESRARAAVNERDREHRDLLRERQRDLEQELRNATLRARRVGEAPDRALSSAVEAAYEPEDAAAILDGLTFQAELHSEEAWVDRATIDELGERYEQLRAATSAEGATEEDFARLDTFASRMEHRRTAFERDPAGYVLSTFPEVSASFNDALDSRDTAAIERAADRMIAVQRDLGAGTGDIRILSDNLTAYFLDSLEPDLSDPNAVAAFSDSISGFFEMFGSAAPRAFAELEEAGMSPRTMAAARFSDTPLRAAAMRAALTTDSDLNSVVSRETRDDIDSEVRRRLQPLLQSASPGISDGGTSESAAIIDQAVHMATQLAYEGHSTNRASRMVTDTLLQEYNFVDDVRVPRQYDQRAVRETIDSFIDLRLTSDNILPLETADQRPQGSTAQADARAQAEETLSQLRRDGYWRTSPDEESAILYHVAGLPARWGETGAPGWRPPMRDGAPGSIIEVRFEDASRRTVSSSDDTLAAMGGTAGWVPR